MSKKLSRNQMAVVVDSNALYTNDIGKISGSKFEGAWKESSQLADINLLVPEVVKGERLYQLVMAAGRAVDNAVKNFDTITKVAALPSPKLPDLNTLKAG